MDDRHLFVAVADAGSFAGAARKVGLSRSTLLRRVTRMEETLGVVLVHRAGPRIALSEDGQRYAEQLRPLLQAIDQVKVELKQAGTALSGTLWLWLPVLGTTVGMAAALAEFRRTHPGVQLVVEVADTSALRVGDFDVARTLYRERLLLVAAPDYIDQHGTPTVDSLPRHQSIAQLDTRGRASPWRYPDGTRVDPPPAVVTVNAVAFAHHLAVLGQGIARVPRTLAGPDLVAGRLVQVLPEIWVEEPVSFVFPDAPGPVARAFLEEVGGWLTRHFGG